MRDHPHHNVPIFGGMFGLKNVDDFDLLHNMNIWLNENSNKDLKLYFRDVEFLTSKVYN